tara:strand:+ start:2035 stop:2223 length:189 start_codon:yes stop_codon:yes gene_type:complete
LSGETTLHFPGLSALNKSMMTEILHARAATLNFVAASKSKALQQKPYSKSPTTKAVQQKTGL